MRPPLGALRLGLLAALVASAAPLVGCSEEVPPADELGRPFTLYGALTPDSARQALRVVPISGVLNGPSDAPIDAAVEAIELESGRRWAWRDSLVRFPDGQIAHVFLADFTPQYGRTYEVRATRSDGVFSRAYVDVPPAVEPLVLLPAQTATGFILRTLWAPAPALNAVRVTYLVQLGPVSQCRYREFTEVLRPDEVSPTQLRAYPTEFGWRVDLPFSPGRTRALLEQARVGESRLWQVTMEALVTNGEWRAPFGFFTYDPELLVEPNVLTNVENGFGFVGAAYTARIVWEPGGAFVPGFISPETHGC